MRRMVSALTAALLLLALAAPAAAAPAPVTEGVSVVLVQGTDPSVESAQLMGVSAGGEVLWTYATGSYQRVQLARIAGLGIYEGVYYLLEDGTVIALSTADGSLLWKNSDFGGSAYGSAFGGDGVLYLCGYDGPDIFAVDARGNTVRRIQQLDSGYACPYEIRCLESCLAVNYELTPTGLSETLYVDLSDGSYSHDPVGEDTLLFPSAAGNAVSFATATSYLTEPQYGLDHLPVYAIDGTLENAWVENAAGQGEGESLTLQLTGTRLLSGFTIHAGYQKSVTTYTNNSRPSMLAVTFSDGTGVTVFLQDHNGAQSVMLPAAVETSSVTFTILSVYPGTKYEDTVISEIALF